MDRLADRLTGLSSNGYFKDKDKVKYFIIFSNLLEGENL